MIALFACNGPSPVDSSVVPSDSATGHVDSATDTGRDTADTSSIAEGFVGLAGLGIQNVVVVHVDTFRADHLPWYGYPRETMPNARSRSWMVVDGLYATSSWTLPSTASVLTAMDVQHHGVAHTDAAGHVTPWTVESVATHLQTNGWATWLASGNLALAAADGYTVGFDEVLDPGTSVVGVDLDELVPETLGWIDAQEGPFYAFLQPMDMHMPYDPGAPYLGTWSSADSLPFETTATPQQQAEQIHQAWLEAGSSEAQQAVLDEVRAVYDEEILSVDHGLELLLDGLQARGRLTDTLVVLSGDHGETIVDDPAQFIIGHGDTARRELLRVPLMFHNPRIAEQSFDCLSQNTDVGPTVFRALGLSDMSGTDGHALQDGCRDLARSSTFRSDIDNVLPVELHVTDGVYGLRWECSTGIERRYNYRVDPTGVAPAPDWPAEGVLEATMEAFDDDLDSSLGSEGCFN